MEEKLPGMRSTSSARSIGQTKTKQVATSEDFLKELKNRKQKSELLAEKNGRLSTFKLVNEKKQSGLLFMPIDVVYIPEDFANIPYIAGLVEKGPDGEYLTGMQQIRYVKRLNTIFAANQPESVVVDYLNLETTTTLNEKKNKNLVSWLKLSNRNEKNPIRFNESNPSYYELVEEELENVEFLKDQRRYEAESIVFTEPLEKLYPLATMFNIPLDSEINMKAKLRKIASNTPDKFLDMYTHPDLLIMEKVVIAFELGVLKAEGRKIKWRDGNVLTVLPPSAKSIDYIVGLIKDTDTDKDYMDLIEKEIDFVLSKRK